MPGTVHQSLDNVAHRLATVMGPWSHADTTRDWDLRSEDIALVRVYGISGSISVRGVSGDRASLHVRKVVHIPQVGAAEAFVSRIRVRVRSRDQGLYVRVLHPRPPLGGRVFVHLTLQVPHAVDVDLRTGRGPLSVRRVEGAVQAHTRAGNVAVRDCLGPITLESGDGILDVADVEGGVDLQGGRGLIRLDTITGRVRVQADRADLTATGIRGRLDAKVRQGSVDLSRGAGRVRLQVGTGDVRAAFTADHRDATVTNHRGPVRLSLGSVSGRIRAETLQGDIALLLDSTFSGRLEAVTHAGRVHAALPRPCPGSGVERLDVQVGGSGTAHVWMASAAGDIYVKQRSNRRERSQEEENG